MGGLLALLTFCFLTFTLQHVHGFQELTLLLVGLLHSSYAPVGGVDVKACFAQIAVVVDVVGSIHQTSDVCQRLSCYVGDFCPKLFLRESALQLLVILLVQSAHHIVERVLLMSFASDVNVHEQTDDRALEVVVHPHVALVAAPSWPCSARPTTRKWWTPPRTTSGWCCT